MIDVSRAIERPIYIKHHWKRKTIERDVLEDCTAPVTLENSFQALKARSLALPAHTDQPDKGGGQ